MDAQQVSFIVMCYVGYIAALSAIVGATALVRYIMRCLYKISDPDPNVSLISRSAFVPHQ